MRSIRCQARPLLAASCWRSGVCEQRRSWRSSSKRFLLRNVILRSCADRRPSLGSCCFIYIFDLTIIPPLFCCWLVCGGGGKAAPPSETFAALLAAGCCLRRRGPAVLLPARRRQAAAVLQCWQVSRRCGCCCYADSHSSAGRTSTLILVLLVDDRARCDQAKVDQMLKVCLKRG